MQITCVTSYLVFRVYFTTQDYTFYDDLVCSKCNLTFIEPYICEINHACDIMDFSLNEMQIPLLCINLGESVLNKWNQCDF